MKKNQAAAIPIKPSTTPSSASSAHLRRDSVSHATPDALRADIERLRAWLTGFREQDVVAKHEIALLVHRIVGNKDKARKGAVNCLAEEVGFDRASLYRWADVAAVWPDWSTLERLIKPHSAKGYALSWSHLELLARVNQPEDRDRLIKEAIRSSLSVRALRSIIGSKAPTTAGRTSKPVRTAPSSAGAWARAKDMAVENTSLLDEITKASPSTLSPEGADALKALAGSCESIVVAVRRLLAANAAELPSDSRTARLAR